MGLGGVRVGPSGSELGPGWVQSESGYWTGLGQVWGESRFQSKMVSVADYLHFQRLWHRSS